MLFNFLYAKGWWQKFCQPLLDWMLKIAAPLLNFLGTYLWPAGPRRARRARSALRG